MKLDKTFYQRDDVIQISKELLGKYLYTRWNGITTGGIITETEAYAGINDKASHAYGNRKTKRTQVMYETGGTAYVYLCYGIHSLFNVVTNKEGIPHAVLIRAIQPVEGIDIILKRRNKILPDKSLTTGPGSVTQALGIHFSHTGISLRSNKIWIEDKGLTIPDNEIIIGPRVGIDYAGEDAKLPYRFRIQLADFTPDILLSNYNNK